MKKRLLCVLAAAVLLLGTLVGCGNGSSSGSNPDTPGVESTEPDTPGVGSTEPDNSDTGGHTDDDPVAVINERVKAVNDAVNWEYLGVEEKVKAGLLFNSLTAANSPDSRETYDYKPDKPLDYYVWYKMIKSHTEGIVSEDTYAALLKNARPWNVPIAEFSDEDVIETNDFYVYSDNLLGGHNYSRCFLLVKDTDILYCFSVEERWYMANYYENGYYNFPSSDSGSAYEQNALNLSYTGDDVEYIFTPEFWKAFAQTAKFVGKADEDFKDDEYINDAISTIGRRGNGVKIPYIEEWYAKGSYGTEAIREGFKEIIQSSGEEYGFLVIDDFGQGEPTMFFNNGLYKYTGGEVALIHDFSDIDDGWMSMSIDPDRTCLLFSGEPIYGENLRIVDLKTFEVTDEVNIYLKQGDDHITEFASGDVNGVSVDEETAWETSGHWIETCNIGLLGRGGIGDLDLNVAWKEYENRG